MLRRGLFNIQAQMHQTHSKKEVQRVTRRERMSYILSHKAK